MTDEPASDESLSDEPVSNESLSDESAFVERLQEFVGMQSGPASNAPDEVNQAMIRHFVEAVGDENPVYTDEKAARAVDSPE